MHTDNKFYDVIIIGGGLAGLQTAISLGQSGLSIAVIDKDSIDTIRNNPFDGRTCAIAWASANLLKHTGVWQHIKDDACPMREVLIQDGDLHSGKSHMDMSYSSALADGEDLGYIVENNALRQAQFTTLHQMKNITFMEKQSVKDMTRTQQKASVILEDDTTLECKLIIACDGRFSKSRQHVGIPSTHWQYSQTSIVCTVQCEKPHNNKAIEFFMPNGPFAMLPMNGNRVNIIWSEENHTAPKLLALDTDTFKSHLMQRFGDWLGDFNVIQDKRYSYPLSFHHAKRYTDTRFVMVADAAHAMHPIAGQGLNMGLRDVAALAEVVENAHKNKQDIGMENVLSEYEQYRYADNATIATTCDALVRLFSNKNPALRIARRIGLTALNRVPIAKKFFMQHAMGTIGTHIPPLLKQYH